MSSLLFAYFINTTDVSLDNKTAPSDDSVLHKYISYHAQLSTRQYLDSNLLYINSYPSSKTLTRTLKLFSKHILDEILFLYRQLSISLRLDKSVLLTINFTGITSFRVHSKFLVEYYLHPKGNM